MATIAGVVLTHKRARIPEIDRAWRGDYGALYRRLRERGAREALVLKTCNRLEVYVVAEEGPRMLLELARVMSLPRRKVEFLDHRASLLHLLRLASSLESMVVGEDQILGQIKEHADLARRHSALGGTLGSAVERALRTGKRVRRETRINRGMVSIGSLAVELAEGTCGGLRGKRVLLMGAGVMGRKVAQAILKRQPEALWVASRTFARARALASEIGAEAVPWREVEDRLRATDVLVAAAAAPHPILSREMAARAARGRRLLILDLGSPRNVEEGVAGLPGVRVCALDSLRGLSTENLEKRREEVARAEAIVAEELAHLEALYARKAADALLSKIYRKAEDVRRQELRRALRILRPENGGQEVVEALSRSIVNKILAAPTQALKAAAQRGDDGTLAMARQLFLARGAPDR